MIIRIFIHTFKFINFVEHIILVYFDHFRSLVAKPYLHSNHIFLNIH